LSSLQQNVFLLGTPLPPTRDNEPEPKPARRYALPEGAWPRLMRAPMAAAYLSISLSMFFAEVKARRLPQPKRIGRCVLWDRRELDLAADLLPGGENIDNDHWSDVEL
jgi:predicted DNA-binding transcriptional regulator AlpA